MERITRIMEKEDSRRSAMYHSEKPVQTGVGQNEKAKKG